MKHLNTVHWNTDTKQQITKSEVVSHLHFFHSQNLEPYFMSRKSVKKVYFWITLILPFGTVEQASLWTFFHRVKKISFDLRQANIRHGRHLVFKNPREQRSGTKTNELCDYWNKGKHSVVRILVMTCWQYARNTSTITFLVHKSTLFSLENCGLRCWFYK